MDLKDASLDDIIEELYERKKKDFSLKYHFYDAGIGTMTTPHVTIDFLAETPRMFDVWKDFTFDEKKLHWRRTCPGTGMPVW